MITVDFNAVQFAQSRLDKFYETLAEEYRELFKNDPDYSYSASHVTPEQLARKMTLGLDNGTASKDGKGIERTCKALGIKHTYAAIRAYLTGK